MRPSGGFTQLELVVCVALAVLLVAVATPRAAAWGDIARAHGAAYALAGTLRHVRSAALERGETLAVRFDPGTATWETRDLQGAVLNTNHLPPRLQFSSLPASRQIRFGGTGRSDNATIALVCGGSTVRVVVNQRGRVRIG